MNIAGLRSIGARLDAVDPQLIDPRSALGEQIARLPVDQLVQDGPPQLAPRETRILSMNAPSRFPPKRHLEQLGECQQPEFHRIVGVVGVVGDAVGCIDDLRLHERPVRSVLFLRPSGLSLER